tara:strand:+ start:402 stop:626 length:225 start_codon:yes stop_codon:yes gene_type:complete
MKNGSITTVLTPNTETTYWKKTVSTSISLDIDDIGFGNGQITIYGCENVITVVDRLDKLIEELQKARKELFFSI